MSTTTLIRQFQVYEDYFNDILVSNNVHRISPFLAGEWVLLEPEFGIITKQEFINAIQAGRLRHQAMKKEVVRVHSENDIVIATSRGMNVGIYEDQPFNSEHWVTNLYKKQGDTWICIMTQEAPVVCK